MAELNTIHERDCIKGMAALEPGSVDLAFADPPFNIGYDYDVYDDAREAEHYLDWSQQWISGVHQALKPTGTFWLAIGDEYAAELKIISQKIGFHCRSWVIWYYTFGVNCKKKFSRSHAHLFHFVKNPKSYSFNDKAIRIPSARQLVYADGRANPDGRLPDDTWILRPQDVREGFRSTDDTWYFPRVAGTFKERAGFHGCQMPEQLLGRIIRLCSNPGDLVLDPFSGSATTLVVAKKLERRWVGFDLSSDYVKRGRARLKKAEVGAALEGAPEPLVSAPATPAAQTDTRKVKDSTRSLQSRRSADENGSRLEDKPLQFGDDSKSRAKTADNLERGIVESFRGSNKGFSVDRLIADDELNEAFARRCTLVGLPGEVVDWNRALLRLRKAGKLSHVLTKRKTEFDWAGVDLFLFASEIALSRMEERGKSLDEVLCDPKLRQEFDKIACAFAPGFAAFDYRWAALRLRKVACSTLKKAATIDDQELQRPVNLLDASLKPFHQAPGLYLISREKAAKEAGSALYAGVTLDLEQRLGMIIDGSKLHASWMAYAKTDRLFVKTLKLDASGRGNLISQFTKYQSRLVGKFDPVLNFKNQTFRFRNSASA